MVDRLILEDVFIIRVMESLNEIYVLCMAMACFFFGFPFHAIFQTCIAMCACHIKKGV